MSQLALYLLGVPRVEVAGKEIHIGRRKALALLFYLAVTQRTHSRESLAAFFWPDYESSQALAYLRRVLSELKTLLGEFALDIERDTCGIQQDTVWLDVSEFQMHLTAYQSHAHNDSESCEACMQHLQSAAELYRGKFLEGLTLPESAGFDEWRFFQTESFRQDLSVILEHLTRWQHSVKAYTTAIRYGRRWLALDSLNEAAHRCLMELYFDAGQKSAALHQYQLCARTLTKELNIAPSDQTTALYEWIRNQTAVKPTSKSLSAERSHLRSSVHPPPNNLPAQLTSFIGREEEISEIQEMVLRPGIRLLTLTGPGGSGKTRLSLAVAKMVLNEFPDGVYFVPLASLRDPALVLDAIAQAFGLSDAGDMTLLEIIEVNLRGKSLLLVLDNFEHVVQAAPEITLLLTLLPHMKVLVTSRALLRVTGEINYPVQPMYVPDTEETPDLPQVTQNEAVQLFVERARALKPGFALTKENVELVVDICRRLDGLPLAIELAAARMRVLSLQGLLSNLENRLQFLKRGSRDLLDRQRTLHNTIAWSYALLGEEEQVLFRRLAVFAGGCTHQSAQAIWSTSSKSSKPETLCLEVLTSLERLIEQSLLQQLEVNGRVRFTMLETIREYALEQLAGSDECDAVQRAHAHFFLKLAEQAEPQLDGPDAAFWLARLESELDNIRTALTWALDNDIALALRLPSMLENFWIFQARLTEGRHWLVQAKIKSEESDSDLARLRARALSVACVLAWWQGDSRIGAGYGEQSVAIYRSLDDKHGLAGALRTLGLARMSFDYSTHILPLLEESVSLYQETHDTIGLVKTLNCFYPWRLRIIDKPAHRSKVITECFRLAQEIGALNEMALAKVHMGFIAWSEGDFNTAVTDQEISLELFQKVGNTLGAPLALEMLGTLYFLQGDYKEARGYFQRTLDWWLKAGNNANVAEMHLRLGDVALYQAQLAEATSRYLTSLSILQNIDIHNLDVAWCLLGLARLVDMKRQPEQVQILLGAAEKFRLRPSTDPLNTQVVVDELTHRVHTYLDEQAIAAAYAIGRAMTREQAIAFGLEVGAMLEVSRT